MPFSARDLTGCGTEAGAGTVGAHRHTAPREGAVSPGAGLGDLGRAGVPATQLGGDLGHLAVGQERQHHGDALEQAAEQEGGVGGGRDQAADLGDPAGGDRLDQPGRVRRLLVHVDRGGVGRGPPGHRPQHPVADRRRVRLADGLGGDPGEQGGHLAVRVLVEDPVQRVVERQLVTVPEREQQGRRPGFGLIDRFSGKFVGQLHRHHHA
ncbi:hypothetical protein ACFQ0M_18265 [Kitasatospora aburaviensis]